MNWTGGRLRQSKRTVNSLSVTQRNRFAKARARLQCGPKNSSAIRFTLFEHEEHNGALLPQIISGRAKTPRKHGLQRPIEEIDNVAPPAERPSPLEPKEVQQSPDPEASSGLSQDQDLLSFSRATRPHLQKSRDISIPSRSRTTTLRDQVYGTKSLEHSGRGRYEHPLMSVEDLEAKRLELLKRPDWLDLTATRPLKIKFPSIEDKARVGRRRRLTKEDLERRHRGLHAGFRPCAIGSNLVTRHTPHLGKNRDEDLVRVGSSVHGTQGSQKKSNRHHPVHQMIERSQNSDEALFNPTDVTGQLSKSDDMLFSSIHSSDDTAPMLLDNESDQMVRAFDCPRIEEPPTRSLQRSQASDGGDLSGYQDRLNLSRGNHSPELVGLSHLAPDLTPPENDKCAHLGFSVRSSPPCLPLQNHSASSFHMVESGHDQDQDKVTKASDELYLDSKDANTEDWKAFLSILESSFKSCDEEGLTIADKAWQMPSGNKYTTEGDYKKKTLLSTDKKPMPDGKAISRIASNATEGVSNYIPSPPKLGSISKGAKEDMGDENAEWWRFVFGYENDEDSEGLPDLGYNDKANISAIDANRKGFDGQSSMVVEASDT